MDPLKENYTFKEAMRSPYEDEFASAMVQEINNHATRKHQKHIRKSEAPTSQVLRSTWTFCIKIHRSTGDIIKFKARFCADGRVQQLGINFHETYAPVAKWNTIRTCLTIALLSNWYDKAIDFDQAYTQADCDSDVYLYLPAGFHVKNQDRHIVKLIKNLYGLCQGRCNFYTKLKSELTK